MPFLSPHQGRPNEFFLYRMAGRTLRFEQRFTILGKGAERKKREKNGGKTEFNVPIKGYFAHRLSINSFIVNVYRFNLLPKTDRSLNCQFF